MAHLRHPSEVLRRKLLADKSIHITELSLVISQVKNHPFLYDPELVKACEAKLKEVDEAFNALMNPSIVDN